MLKESVIATTAMSSFNNAALLAPFFAVVGLLTLPLLWIVYMYSHSFSLKFGWNKHNMDNLVGFWSSLFLIVWLLLGGGNYAVMRDSVSLLPVLNGAMLLALVAVVTQKSFQLDYVSKIQSKKIRFIMIVALFLMAGMSGYGNLWYMLLQIVAVISGIIVGIYVRKNIGLIPLNVFICIMMAILVLMQPEFFRFGQLGNLTVVHLLAIVITGLCAITALTTKYIRARGRIHHSAYIKLKWLFRIMSLLAFVLFMSTESVPIFIGFLMATWSLEMLSIYHSEDISENVSKQSFANLLICVGILIICPAVSGIGVLYLASLSKKISFKEFLALL
ncbi:MAG: hypothetical protein J6S57_01285 [Alphaproteobacteria bacterium]|nr:hypothetical protein [Alphaproteobacteria bacterium]